MQTNTDIANMALTYVGAGLLTNIEDDRTPEGKLARTFFDISRQAELEVFDWSFARRFQILATAPGPSPDVRFSGVYLLPVDCLAPRNIEPLNSKAPIPYQVAQSDTGQRLILTSQPLPTLRYTFDQEDPGAFTTNFTLALSHRLASYIAYARTNKQSLRESELFLAKEARLLAQANDGNTSQEPEGPPPAEWHIDRGFSVNIRAVDPISR